MDKKAIIEETEKYYLPVFGRYPMVMELGQGCRVWDNEGNEYVDAFAGIAVNSLGYNHPVLVKAISEQAAKLMHCSNLYYTEIQAKALRVVAEATGMDRIFFANCGAEGNEGAMKLARKYGVSKAPTKYKIISADESFHGRTFDTLAATGHDYYHVGYGPLSPGHVLVPYGDIKALEAQMDDDVCAVLLEPIQGEGGVHVPPDEYLQQVRALCDKHDALLIFDEVQTGVARTGKWFAYMHSGVKPDILTFAKGIGGGFPVAGFAVPERLAHVFKPGDHGGTFGGNPLACAAVYATLTTIKSEGLVDKVAEKGEYFKNELRKLQEKYPDKVTDVRGCGLMLGMEVAGEGKPIVESCLANNVIVNCTAGNVIRIVPPLIISREEIDIVVAALDKALAAC
ncbi:aspartate aminotransferase family protein [Phascolarctobacterium succinatutens]|uniref:aspartate aminotransferase family protein n=1 Tax=Phascolarctobacterium succinatutens TaxID=626940 RepID=UPI002E767554|nr:aspartate aminotransferase family protein [Phascolarctobacterium succinatutens]MEE0507892.1 aspartate aminotransferase family protein [Phascolarctobacterium succinatutens]